jgi:hypothetical protein
MKDGYQVLKASYIFPRGQGYDNFMRIFGAYDCSENVGTDVINYLKTGHNSIPLKTAIAKFRKLS